MPNINLEAHIPAERERVFASLVDPARYREWQPLHESWPNGLPDVAPGSTFVQRTRSMGRSSDVTWTVRELEAPSTIVLEGEGPMGLSIRSAYTLEDAEPGTRLGVRSEFDGGPAPVRRILARRGEAVAAESIDNLTALLCDDGGGPMANAHGAPGLAPGTGRRARPSAPRSVVNRTIAALTLGPRLLTPPLLRSAAKRLRAALPPR